MNSDPGYGHAFARWRQAAPDWNAYTRHSFVEGMRYGTLPHAAYLKYLVQDYLFLIHFARAWALAVVKAGDLDEMRTCSATVHTLLDHEMTLHIQTCAKAGIEPEDREGRPSIKQRSLAQRTRLATAEQIRKFHPSFSITASGMS